MSDPGQDPNRPEGAGPSKEPPDLEPFQHDQVDQQQTQMPQLEENLLHSEQTAAMTREKIAKYTNTFREINAVLQLSKMKSAEAKKNKPEDASNKPVTSTKYNALCAAADEQTSLCQQKLEKYRAAKAEREKNKKKREEIINQNLLTTIKSKDDKITELTEKLQKLKESIKEKDSIIDAKTKSVFLLNEDLRKQDKTTLDKLSNTKDQMKNMQQNFGTLEAQMKIEILNLKAELVIKDNRIKKLEDTNITLNSYNVELQERLTKLNVELENYKIQNAENEEKIQELNRINTELQSKISEPVDSSPQVSPQKSNKRKGNKKSKNNESIDPQSSSTSELKQSAEIVKSSQSLQNDEEIDKLKKQLEEMNKNMIKLKAQYKAKLKEVQKKVTPSELNEKVSNLESENLKLGQRVAELEDEKGNLQLRLVDFEANKEKEYIAELENKIEEQKMQIENHIRTITTLESQISTSSNEISSLRNELSNLMHIENAQVCSEMTSVQLEEQLDKVLSQKKEIQDKFNEIVKENEGLQEKIDVLNKEKQELSQKLDNYMQENIELIDRLEKLSAEKVSSAESIEIVESLTQQERLEIEAYQKNLEFIPDSEKPHDECVEQISDSKSAEETTSPTELLQRIELFTVERREVMDKMETLAIENQQLRGKIDNLTTENQKLLKNNQNIDIHDLNKLQEEIVEYKAMLENQKIQIFSLQEELWNKPDQLESEEKNKKLLESNESLTSQLRTLQLEIETMYSSNEMTKQENEELLQKIQFLQSCIEENKQELIKAADSIAELDKSLLTKNEEIDSLQETIIQMNDDLKQTEINKENEISLYSSQIEEINLILDENISKLKQSEVKLQENSSTITDLQFQIEELNYKITENQHKILSLQSEKNSLIEEKNQLKANLESKSQKLVETCEKLKEKCQSLEKQINENNGSIEDIKGPLESKIEELGVKNKELVEKLKKVAANLKKKSVAYQDLEHKLAENQEKWEFEKSEKDEKINSLLNQLQDVEVELTNKQSEIIHLNTQINIIKSETDSSHKEYIQSLINQIEELRIKSETSRNALEAKLQEKDMFIENLEAENNKFKHQVFKLEDYLSTFEERRKSLEEKALNLKVQLDEKSFACAEATQSEDILEQRLSALIERDDHLRSQINQYTIENENLNEKIKSIHEENEKLHHKLQESSAKILELNQNIDKVETLENEISKLNNTILNLEMECKKRQAENEKIVNEKNLEIENLEQELNLQLQELHAERKTILNRCEVLEDNLKEYQETETILNDEINKLKQDLDNQIDPNLQQQLINLQNQIIKKDVDIQNYQKQNMQLQMSAANFASGDSNLFDLTSNQSTELENLHEKLNNLQEEFKITQKELEIQRTVNINLELEMKDLNLKLVRQTAQENVEEIITKAKSSIINETMSEEESKEALLRKIKALEFMLFNIEQEKDDSLKLCHEFTDELTRLVYERESLLKNNPEEQIIQKQSTTNLQLELNSESNKSIESQIVSPDQTKMTPEECKIFHDFEFTPIEFPSDTLDHSIPVMESIPDPKTAYLCYPEPKDSIESQVVHTDQIKITPEERKQFQQFEYQTVNLTQKDSDYSVPVQEKIPPPKTAYLCYPEPQDSVDSQVIKPDQIKITPDERKQFQQFEYQTVDLAPKDSDHSVPVQDKIPPPKTAYFCFPEPKDSVDSQVIKPEQIKITPDERMQFQQIEFQNVHWPQKVDFDHSHPVQENIPAPKTAYLCYPEPKSSIESQVIQSDELKITPDERIQFQQVEFQTVNWPQKDVSTHPGPVQENIPAPKTAYLCFPEPQDSVESQVIQSDQIRIAPDEREQLQQIEFQNVHWPQKVISDHPDPVKENVPAPKTAYLCHSESQVSAESQVEKNVLGEDTFASEEDGWGWNAEEAKLEAEHRLSLSAASQIVTSDSRIEQLEERIHDLEVERARLLEEIKTFQIRSGKLIKKLKLMKEQNDSLLASSSKKSASDEFGLDSAIEEELNLQIKNLEKKVKEISEENSKDKSEKENLLKRIDVLQSANDRMIEMKEKTDNEIQFLQFKNHELSSKLEQLEWGFDSPIKTTDSTTDSSKIKEETSDDYKQKYQLLHKEVDELKTTINDLTIDNEEMQLMLEEQRKIKTELVKTEQELTKTKNEKDHYQQELNNLHEINRNLEEKINELKKNLLEAEQKSGADIHKTQEEFTTLQNELKQLQGNKQKLEENLNQYIQNNDELNAKSAHLQLNIENLMQENHMMNNNYTLRIEQIQNENIELLNQITSLQHQKESTLQEISRLQQIESNFVQKEIEFKHLQENLQKLENEKLAINLSVSEKEAIIQSLNQKNSQLESEKISLESRLQDFMNIQNEDKTNDEKLQQLLNSISILENKNKELLDLNNTLSSEKQEIEIRMSSTMEQLAQEWSERVDQRGNDVAESWKLHLDSVENEFSQKEAKLREELNEIFIKNEEIIAQNNELQKQIDLIIKEKQNIVEDNINIIQNLQQNINHKQTELMEMETKLQNSNLELEIKNKEIEELKNVRQLLEMKEVELQESNLQLENKILECQNLLEKIEELNSLIENKVLKIEDLKKQLEEKNNEHEALLVDFNNFEKEYLKASQNQPESASPSADLDKTVSDSEDRAKLDLALYMLHQRDVRCEEFTIELMQLLEERDILQLKLSNEIKLNEELKQKLITKTLDHSIIKDLPSTGAIPKSKAIVLEATNTELATEATETFTKENRENLNQKLSQLKSVGYRDKTIKDDQEIRHIQQLSLMQYHGDLTANLPPEAAARLVDANYTLSRDVQSPSKVLLNWFWGRSTPKVNDV